jgi:hypothetical protein
MTKTVKELKVLDTLWFWNQEDMSIQEVRIRTLDHGLLHL